MIVKLKIAPQAKLLVTFVSKSYQRNFFSKYEVCNQEKDEVRHDACCLKQTSKAVIEIYIFPEVKLYIKPDLKK